MATITSTFFNAAPEQVWDAITDLHHAADRISAIKRLEVLGDGTIGEGTRFRETRVMFKKEATEEMEITRWEPPECYAVECESCGSHYATTFRCIPEGDGTRVEITWDVQPLTFTAKVMGGLMGRLMLNACRKMFDKDLEDVRRSVEGSPTPQPA
jgi:carbon monoxide dehydrogenase subunit G